MSSCKSYGSFSSDMFYADLLIDSIIAGNLSEAMRLMEKAGADPNVVVPERGAAAFHLIAGAGGERAEEGEGEWFALAAAAAALRAGGDPNVRSHEGMTPVHVAAAWGRGEVLQLLLRHGGDPCLLDFHLMDAGDYALRERHWAVYGMLAARTGPPIGDLVLLGSRAERCRRRPSAEDGEDEDDDDDDSGWLDSFSDSVRLDDAALRTIRGHRRGTRVYEWPKAQMLRAVDELEETPEESDGEVRSSDRRGRRPVATEPRVDAGPALPARNSRPASRGRRCRRAASELYVCEIAESYGPGRLACGSEKSDAAPSRSDASEGRRVSRMLTGVSRILTVMLKKRRVYEKLK